SPCWLPRGRSGATRRRPGRPWSSPRRRRRRSRSTWRREGALLPEGARVDPDVVERAVEAGAVDRADLERRDRGAEGGAAGRAREIERPFARRGEERHLTEHRP